MASSGSTAPVLVVPALDTTAKGVNPLRAIRPYGRSQGIHRKAVGLVARNGLHAVRHDARELRGLEHRVVRLVGRVDHAAAGCRSQVTLARAQESVERGHRPAGREQPTRAARESPSSRAASRARWPPTAEAPAHAIHTPVNRLVVSAMKSASAAGYVPPPGMNARYPPDGALNDRGTQVSKMRSSSGAKSLPCGGAPSRRARQRSAASTSPQMG